MTSKNLGLNHLEDRAEHGKRRTDVLVRGADGFLLGCEAQISYATAASVRKRTAIAGHDGITSLWTTNDRKAQLIDQAPWARIDRMPWHHIAHGADLPVRGGIRALLLERCADRPTVCPDRNRGRCQRWHASWAPREMRLDDLIVRAAGQEHQPVHVPTTRGAGHWFWISATDKATYLSSLAERNRDEEADAEPRARRKPVTPKPVNRTCTYGQDTGVRAEATPTRDTGAVIEAPTVNATHLSRPQQLPVDRPLGGIQPLSAPAGAASKWPVSDRVLVGPAAIHPIDAEPDAWFTTRPSCGHIWPPEIEPRSGCLCCGLQYDEYAA